MDITSISSSNNQYMSLFKPQSAMNKAQSQFSNNLTNNLSANAKKVAATNTNKGSAASNIILAKKGQTKYCRNVTCLCRARISRKRAGNANVVGRIG